MKKYTSHVSKSIFFTVDLWNTYGPNLIEHLLKIIHLASNPNLWNYLLLVIYQVATKQLLGRINTFQKKGQQQRAFPTERTLNCHNLQPICKAGTGFWLKVVAMTPKLKMVLIKVITSAPKMPTKTTLFWSDFPITELEATNKLPQKLWLWRSWSAWSIFKFKSDNPFKWLSNTDARHHEQTHRVTLYQRKT